MCFLTSKVDFCNFSVTKNEGQGEISHILIGVLPRKRRQRKDGEDAEELVRPPVEAPISESKGGKAAKGCSCHVFLVRPNQMSKMKVKISRPAQAPLPRGQKSKAPNCLQVIVVGNLQLRCTARPKRSKKSMRIRPANTCQFCCINEGSERKIFLSETMVQALQVQEWHMVRFFCPG